MPAGKHPSDLPRISGRGSETSDYHRDFKGTSLREDLKGAAFVITINSNSIVECLERGIPVLAFGPSLAINARAVRKCTVATLASDIRAMRAGWTANDDAVRRYLEWLASRQFSVDELSNPQELPGILDLITGTREAVPA